MINIFWYYSIPVMRLHALNAAISQLIWITSGWRALSTPARFNNFSYLIRFDLIKRGQIYMNTCTVTFWVPDVHCQIPILYNSIYLFVCACYVASLLGGMTINKSDYLNCVKSIDEYREESQSARIVFIANFLKLKIFTIWIRNQDCCKKEITIWWSEFIIYKKFISAEANFKNANIQGILYFMVQSS